MPARLRSAIRRFAPLVAAAGVMAAGALVVPATAGAGVYTVAQCHASINPTPGQASYEQSTGAPYEPDNGGCAGGAGLQIQHSTVADPAAPGAYGAWVWRAPAGTVFTRIDAEASLIDQPSGDDADLWAARPDGQQVAFGAEGATFAPADVLTGEFVQFYSMLRCTSALCDPSMDPAARADVRNVLLRTDDRTAPTATISGGSMFAAAAVRGERTVGFEVADQGGGVREVELRVNEEAVFADDLGCQVNQDFALALQPCAGQAGRTVSLATSARPFATGTNEISACGTDLALDGLANGDCKNRDVFVDDICPASTVGGGTGLSAKWVGRKKPTIKVQSNRRPRLKGKLTASGSYSESGAAAVAGATICALTHVKLGGEPFVVAKTTRTRNNGRYSMRLPAGANRDVYVHYVFGEQIVARHGLSIESRVRPSFEIKPRKQGDLGDGERLRFKGELPGPSCDGRVVKVQAKVGKRRWQVFRGVRTNDDCRYRTRFKLRATSQPTRYLFRVRVPEQAQYPYEAGVSTVRVREAGPA